MELWPLGGVWSYLVSVLGQSVDLPVVGLPEALQRAQPERPLCVRCVGALEHQLLRYGLCAREWMEQTELGFLFTEQGSRRWFSGPLFPHSAARPQPT